MAMVAHAICNNGFSRSSREAHVLATTNAKSLIIKNLLSVEVENDFLNKPPYERTNNVIPVCRLLIPT
jgi:hypothetical protein